VEKDTACKYSIEKKRICFNCPKIVKLTDTAFSLFNKCFHKKCVSHHHKMHIHEEEKDSSVCHMYAVSRLFL
jgi:hypothetical protein